MVDKTNADYDKPPILEAVIVINFLNTISSEDVLEKVANALKANYDILTPEQEIEIKFKSGIDGEVLDDRSKNKIYRLRSQDTTEIALLKTNQIIFSKLAPYSGWDALFERAKRDWKVLIKELGKNDVSRVGVRFINRIDFPVEAVKGQGLESFFKIYPSIPEKFLGKQIHKYSIQIENKINDEGTMAKVSSGIVPSPVPKAISILLDIDIYCNLDKHDPNDDIWSVIKKFRDHKNKIFESCITDETRRFFDK